jgi:probable F420-dependent oxidoreductase
MRTFASMMCSLGEVPKRVRQLEELGLDGISTGETAHDVFLPLLLAAEHSERLLLRTSIAVGFARTPMTLIHPAHDLNAYSRGRFELGLGSQIKAHITRRFAMPWSHPAARMREMVEAIRAIGANWYEGAPLEFKGDFYQHTLMTPMFTPSDTEFGLPPINVAAVGPLMTQTVAEVADGILLHSFTTDDYIRAVTLPRIEKGLANASRPREACRVILAPFIVTGSTEEDFEQVKASVKNQIGFYGSTPAYRPVLEHHGWGELQSELLRLTKEGRWQELGGVIDDEILRTFAVVGEPREIAPQLHRRFGDFIDDLELDGDEHDDDTIATIVSGVGAPT